MQRLSFVRVHQECLVSGFAEEQVLVLSQCYKNKNNLTAGILVAGWDGSKGGQVYSIPVGGAMLERPFTIGAEHDPRAVRRVRHTRSGPSTLSGRCRAQRCNIDFRTLTQQPSTPLCKPGASAPDPARPAPPYPLSPAAAAARSAVPRDGARRLEWRRRSARYHRRDRRRAQDDSGQQAAVRTALSVDLRRSAASSIRGPRSPALL
eukprot:6193060-Pleurochrysis_carterae.AAC.3